MQNITNSSYKSLICNRGFMSLLTCESLSSFNVTLFKIVLIFLSTQQLTNSQDSGLVTLIAALFIAPTILFSGLGGALADHFNKRHVLMASKIAECIIMGLGVMAFALNKMPLLLGVLFLMAIQTSLNGPAKYGIIPEIIKDAGLIAKANSLMQMTMYIAIISGTITAGWLFNAYHEHLTYIGLFLWSSAKLNTLISFWIQKVPDLKNPKPLSLNVFVESFIACRDTLKSRMLSVCILGMSWFWLVGATLQMLLALFGKFDLQINEALTSQLMIALMVGIACGSLAAGWISKDRIELGLVPIGGIGLVCGLIGLGHVAPSYTKAAIMLGVIGFAGGIFMVPLNAYLQDLADPQRKGQVIAANNILNAIAMVISSVTIHVLFDHLHLTASKIMLVTGGVTLLVTYAMLRILPGHLLRFMLWVLTTFIYRIKVHGKENLPTKGPMLLVANHVSFVDGLLISAGLSLNVRYVILEAFYRNRILHPLCKLMGAIPISMSPRRMHQSIEDARAALSAGACVCIFPEGALTRTGTMQRFKPGFERIVKDLDVPIVPLYLHGVWGSIFSAHGGKFLWKLPMRLPYHVSITIGNPLPSSTQAFTLQQKVAELATQSFENRPYAPTSLAHEWVKNARKRFWQPAISDSSGLSLRFGSALLASTILRAKVATIPQKNIGVMIPASIGATLINLALTMAQKTSVNLNFTVGTGQLEQAIDQAQIKIVITSRQIISKFQMPKNVEIWCIEDLLKQISWQQKIIAGWKAFFTPINKLVGIENPNDIATIIFSSGSTGTPKGVMLTHKNILANMTSVADILPLSPKASILAVLPFFHSFGYTITFWMPLLCGYRAVYHHNPLEARTIGNLVEKYKIEMILTTPTFCKFYIKQCTAKQFASLKICVVGAEKLSNILAEEFYSKFSIPLMEGYGCTELSPVAAVNIINMTSLGNTHIGHKPGTVGHPLPYVTARIVDPNTKEDLGPNESGLLLIKGPNIMQGYLNDPIRTAEVLDADGWYNTGDIAQIDQDGFITIIDRLSRFAKIAGEMIPVIKVEEEIQRLMPQNQIAVTVVPCAVKGEKLILLYTGEQELPDLVINLRNILPPLWIPAEASCFKVQTLPTLATGKMDLAGIKQRALMLIEQPELATT